MTEDGLLCHHLDAKMLAELSRRTFWAAFHDHPKNRAEDMQAYMREAFAAERLAAELADDSIVFLVAESAGEAVGYAKLQVDSREASVQAQKPLELCRLYVQQEKVGGGIGARLMKECLALAKELDCDVVWLGVWEHNPRAQKFYARHGFRIVGRHIFQLGSDPQDDFVMQKDLTGE